MSILCGSLIFTCRCCDAHVAWEFLFHKIRVKSHPFPVEGDNFSQFAVPPIVVTCQDCFIIHYWTFTYVFITLQNHLCGVQPINNHFSDDRFANRTNENLLRRLHRINRKCDEYRIATLRAHSPCPSGAGTRQLVSNPTHPTTNSTH